MDHSKSPDQKNPRRTYRGISKAELTTRFHELQRSYQDALPSDPRETEVQTILHELEVYQIELEMQNRELRESRQELEEAHDLYVNLYDFAPVGYLTLTEQGLIKEINLAAATMLGIERRYLLGRFLAPWIAKKELSIFRAHLKKCALSTETVVSLLHFVTPDHRTVPVELSGLTSIDASTGEALIRISVSDITERRRLEEERDRFFELSSDLNCVIGFGGSFKRLNAAWEKVLGYTIEELVSRPFLDFIHPEDQERTRTEMRECERGLVNGAQFQNRYLKKDGTLVWLSWSAVACGDVVYCVGRDTSLEMAAKFALENQFAWLTDLIYSLPIPLVLADAGTGVVLTSSSQVDKLLDGYSPSILNDPDQKDFFFADSAGKTIERRDWPRFKAMRGITLEGEELSWHTPTRVTHLMVWVRTIPAKYNHPELVLVMLQTVDALKEKETLLSDAVEKLELEHTLREDFVSGLSHDLRTPLTAAKLNVQMLDRNADDPVKREKYVSRILKGIDRIEVMIRDLLDANRIRAGETLPMKAHRFDLSRLIENTVEELSEIHGARLRVECSARITGSWNKAQLRRVIENLVGNAVKYGYPKGMITVSVARQDEYRVTLSVHNFGNPIPEVEQPSLFVQYRRCTSAQKGSSRGWGVGLTLVRGIVQAHGGEVSVTSSLECGTTFTITLPTDSLRGD